MGTTPVFLPGEIHGQRSLVGHSPWGAQRVFHFHIYRGANNKKHSTRWKQRCNTILGSVIHSPTVLLHPTGK